MFFSKKSLIYTNKKVRAMKNIKNFEEFVNENYDIMDEGLFEKTPEKWWNQRMETTTNTKGTKFYDEQFPSQHLKNKEMVEIYKTKYPLTDEDKKRIEEEAAKDKFKGEVGISNGKWIYKPYKTIGAGAYGL